MLELRKVTVNPVVIWVPELRRLAHSETDSDIDAGTEERDTVNPVVIWVPDLRRLHTVKPIVI
jgi:hypothetical protein